jgi:undecaprenyl diphosphate synthase
MQSESRKGLHVAIIMDGNGRWATRRGLLRVAGHRAGVASVRRVVERSLDLGIARLTLYAFSSDNWRRPASEVRSIFWLLRAFLRLETERLRRRGVRLRVIGRRDRLPKVVLCEIEKAESITAVGSCLSLYVAIDYSARDAITRAAIEVNAFLSNKKPPSPDLFQRLLVEGSHGSGRGSGSADPNRWREAPLGLFAVGVRLRRTAVLQIVCGLTSTLRTLTLPSMNSIDGNDASAKYR